MRRVLIQEDESGVLLLVCAVTKGIVVKYVPVQIIMPDEVREFFRNQIKSGFAALDAAFLTAHK